jgi:hypothetical protein
MVAEHGFPQALPLLKRHWPVRRLCFGLWGPGGVAVMLHGPVGIGTVSVER